MLSPPIPPLDSNSTMSTSFPRDSLFSLEEASNMADVSITNDPTPTPEAAPCERKMPFWSLRIKKVSPSEKTHMTVSARTTSEPNTWVYDLVCVSGTTESNPVELILKTEFSFGVNQAKILNAIMSDPEKISLLFSIMFMAWGYGLDSTVRGSVSNEALAKLGAHSLIGTLAVVKTCIGTVSGPAIGKLANAYGRANLLIGGVALFSVGTIVQAVAPDCTTFFTGACLHQVGYGIATALVQTIVTDTSSTKDRVWKTYVPAIPFLFTGLIGGCMVEPMMKTLGWRWTAGIWAAIFPVTTVPVLFIFWSIMRRASRLGITIPKAEKKSFFEWFQLLDIPGMFLIAAFTSCFMIPLSIADSAASTWAHPKIWAPLVLSVPLAITTGFWEETWAKHPMIKPGSLGNRGIWAPLVLAFLLNLSHSMQGDYLYTSLVACYNLSIKWATSIVGIYSSLAVVSGLVAGAFIRKLRCVKWFVFVGSILFCGALVILWQVRSAAATSGVIIVIVAEAVLGFAGGLYPNPNLSIFQASLPHEEQAAMQGIFNAVWSFGSTVGNAIAGMIWRMRLPALLAEAFPNNASLAAKLFTDPMNTAKMLTDPAQHARAAYAVGHTQGFLCMIGAAMAAVPILLCFFALPNIKVNDEQSLVKNETEKNIEVKAKTGVV